MGKLERVIGNATYTSRCTNSDLVEDNDDHGTVKARVRLRVRVRIGPRSTMGTSLVHPYTDQGDIMVCASARKP